MASVPYKRKPTDPNDPNDNDEIKGRTDYGMLVLLARNGSESIKKSAKQLLEIIDEEIDKRKSNLAAEYKMIAAQEGMEPTYEGMLAYIYSHLDVSEVRNELAAQLITDEAPNLRAEINAEKQKLDEEERAKEHSRGKPLEKDDKDRKEDESENKDEITEEPHFNTIPSPEEKVELAKSAQPSFKKIMEDNSPVASALVKKIEETDAKDVINMSTSQAGDFLIAVIASLTEGGGKSYEQSRRILAAITYVDRQYGDNLNVNQKTALVRPLLNYILFYEPINISIIPTLKIKNCAEIFKKFKEHFEQSKIKEDKVGMTLYDFKNFPPEEQFCWFILGYIGELVNSVNSGDKNKGYLMRKELYTYESLLGDEEELEPMAAALGKAAVEPANIQSISSQQARLAILETTPISELSAIEASILDREYPGYRENIPTENELHYIITPINHTIYSSEGDGESSGLAMVTEPLDYPKMQTPFQPSDVVSFKAGEQKPMQPIQPVNNSLSRMRKYQKPVQPNGINSHSVRHHETDGSEVSPEPEPDLQDFFPTR